VKDKKDTPLLTFHWPVMRFHLVEGRICYLLAGCINDLNKRRVVLLRRKRMVDIECPAAVSAMSSG
jgi:hypothetical protein